jgi:hypothetical protein
VSEGDDQLSEFPVPPACSVPSGSNSSSRSSITSISCPHTGAGTAVRIRNDLATPVSGTVVLSLSACDGRKVDGGSHEWTRADGGVTEATVADGVPSETGTTVRACAGRIDRRGPGRR